MSTWLLQMCCATLMAVPSCSLSTPNHPYSCLCPRLWMGTVLCLIHLHKTLLPDPPCHTLVPSPCPHQCPHQTQPGVHPQMEVPTCLVSRMSHQLPQGCCAPPSLVGHTSQPGLFPPPEQSLGARVVIEGICGDKTDMLVPRQTQHNPGHPQPLRSGRTGLPAPHNIPPLAGAPCIEDLLHGSIPQTLQGILAL